MNDALAKRCLKTMTFSINKCASRVRCSAETDADARLRSGALVPEILEEFVFEFAYSSSGAATITVSRKKGADGEAAQAASVQADSLSGLRLQACSILRSLIAAISTLNPLPEERGLSMNVRLRWRGASGLLFLTRSFAALLYR